MALGKFQAVFMVLPVNSTGTEPPGGSIVLLACQPLSGIPWGKDDPWGGDGVGEWRLELELNLQIPVFVFPFQQGVVSW